MKTIDCSYALLLIDIQNEVIDFKNAARSYEIESAFDLLLGRISGLQKWARKHALKTIHVQHDSGKGNRLERGSQGWRIRKEIDVQNNDPIFYKSHCSSFSGTGLDEYLKEQNIGNLIVAGCMTNFCIDTACRVGVERGYNIILAGDGHMTCDDDLTFEQIIKHHNNILSDLSAKNARVMVMSIDEITALKADAI